MDLARTPSLVGIINHKVEIILRLMTGQEGLLFENYNQSNLFPPAGCFALFCCARSDGCP
jgi:hypothetical protein